MHSLVHCECNLQLKIKLHANEDLLYVQLNSALVIRDQLRFVQLLDNFFAGTV